MLARARGPARRRASSRADRERCARSARLLWPRSRWPCPPASPPIPWGTSASATMPRSGSSPTPSAPLCPGPGGDPDLPGAPGDALPLDPQHPAVAAYARGKPRRSGTGSARARRAAPGASGGVQRADLSARGRRTAHAEDRRRYRAALPPADPATLAAHYRDANYADRAGWKEIVAHAAAGRDLVESTAPEADRSWSWPTIRPTRPTARPRTSTRRSPSPGGLRPRPDAPAGGDGRATVRPAVVVRARGTRRIERGGVPAPAAARPRPLLPSARTREDDPASSAPGDPLASAERRPARRATPSPR